MIWGGGVSPKEDFIRIDSTPGPEVDIVHDLESYPWPIPPNISTLIVASQIVQRVNPASQGFLRWMDECWRISKIGGQLFIVTPFGGNLFYLSDPTNCNPCTDKTWNYFDPEHPSKLYELYRPKPWKIKSVFFQADGNMEVLLMKREDARG